MAEDYPNNLMEFNSRFSNEKSCQEYLEQLRWPDGFQCPGCQAQQFWRTKRRTFFCKKCQRQTSVITGTIFEGSKKPLKLWFAAMWLVVCEKNGISAMGLQRQLGLSRYETAWSILKRLRSAMVRSGRELLSGEVEVDETLVGGFKHGKRGRGAEGKELVVIATEVTGNKFGRIRMQRVANADGETLKKFVKDHVSTGSTVITDGWKSYLGIEKLGYKHQRIKGESVGVDELLPHIHLAASLLKRWLLGTHQGGVDTMHLDSYLDEFVFRFNRRTSKSRGKLFYRLAQQAVQVQISK